MKDKILDVLWVTANLHQMNITDSEIAMLADALTTAGFGKDRA